jgi:hypothetical protein
MTVGLYALDGGYKVTVTGGSFTAGEGMAVEGPVAGGTTADGNPVPVGFNYNTTLPTYTVGQRTEAQSDSRGNLRVAPVGLLVAGASGVTNNLVTTASQTNQASSTILPLAVMPYAFNGTSLDQTRKPNAASRIPSAAASTNATSAKASAGDVHVISGFNAAATVRYLKFYAKATAPTVGTDTPVITLALPATSAFNINLNGHYIATGIAYALTTGAADADTGALTAADILGLTITYA